MDTVDVLRKAKEILSDPARWNQGHFAALATGELVYGCIETEARATKWCALGALRVVLGAPQTWEGHPAIAALIEAVPKCEANAGYENNKWAPWVWVSTWNDATTHAELIAAFDRAILAEADKKQAERESDAALAVAPVADAVAVLVGE